MSRKKRSGDIKSTAGSIVETADSKKISRRTFLKVTAGSAAVAGTAALALEVGSEAQTATTTTTGAPPASDPFQSVPITLTVNGKQYSTIVEPRDMLVNVLREHFNLIATKRPCNRQECGGCTVLIDDRPVYSCTYLALRAQGHSILTAEGGSSDSTLAALQTAWVPADASQCGFCQPARILAATALLKKNPNPTPEEIQLGIEGVLCRCGTYMNGITAIQNAAQSIQGGSA